VYISLRPLIGFVLRSRLTKRTVICIGANWLHRRPESASLPVTLVPPKHWAWYALCFDPKSDDVTAPDTVVTFHEAPYYNPPRGEEDRVGWDEKELSSMRTNTRKVLLQLSVCGIKEYQEDILELTAVRAPLMEKRGTLALNRASTLNSDNAHMYLEGSSNLFYYLFEDYGAAISILNESREMLEILVSFIPCSCVNPLLPS
jgi:hypothetical protein